MAPKAAAKAKKVVFTIDWCVRFGVDRTRFSRAWSGHGVCGKRMARASEEPP